MKELCPNTAGESPLQTIFAMQAEADLSEATTKQDISGRGARGSRAGTARCAVWFRQPVFEAVVPE